jgi:hypothetical protein
VQGPPGGLVGALEHLELAPRGSGGLAAPAPGAPDLLAELENIKTPPVAGSLLSTLHCDRAVTVRCSTFTGKGVV